MTPDIWGIAITATTVLTYMGVLAGAGTWLTTRAFNVPIPRPAVFRWAMLGLVASLTGFSLQSAALTGDASGLTDPVMLGLLWSSPAGMALNFKIGGLTLLLLSLYFGKHGTWPGVIGAAMALCSFGVQGHIVDLGNATFLAALLFHVVCAAFWVGILTPLGAFAKNAETLEDAARLGRNFGRLASIGVPALILMGAWMSYRLVGSWTNLFATDYGRALIFKIVLVAALLAIAAANKLRFVPALEAKDYGAAQHLVTAIRIEWVVITCILIATATLTSAVSLPA